MGNVGLDILDAYEYFADRGRVTSAQDMADLVVAIASYLRARDPGFYIISQNAPELASRTIGYLDPTFPIWLNIPLSKSSAFFKPLSICETLAVGMAIITP